ncbi:MAG: gliding motility-associated C-terminal domain-containing protein [Candidatus Cloacimonetes bacterium]|nr:gliding motility-associated C-terminal domain-containing protein [Candidatus Cloacimonadota bacterium]
MYNIKGQKVKTLVKEIKDSGHYQAIWDGTNNNKKQVASGVYFYRLSTSEKTLNKKMLLLK